MAKKMKPVEVGSVVAFNTLKDAEWFEVIAINGFILSIIDIKVENSATQYIDKCFVKQVK